MTAKSVPADCVAFESISVTLPNMSALKDENGEPEPVASAVHKIGGLSWRIEVHRIENGAGVPPKLDMYVYCNEDVVDKLWLCKMLFTVRSGHPGPPEGKLTYNYNPFYGFNSYYWILLDIFDPTVDPTFSPQIDPIEITLELKICQTFLKSLPSLDTSLVINIEGGESETLSINKHSLASFSAYFRNLFFEDWSDKKKKGGNYFEINETIDFDMEAFKFIIYSAMTMGWTVHESNFLDYSLAVAILKLGTKYDMAPLLDYCEKFLIATKTYSQMDLLKMAEQYNLVELKEHSLAHISLFDFMDDFGTSVEALAGFSKATRERLTEKLGGKANETRDLLTDLHDAIAPAGAEPSATLVEPYNKLAKAMMGQRATVLVAEKAVPQ